MQIRGAAGTATFFLLHWAFIGLRQRAQWGIIRLNIVLAGRTARRPLFGQFGILVGQPPAPATQDFHKEKGIAVGPA